MYDWDGHLVLAIYIDCVVGTDITKLIKQSHFSWQNLFNCSLIISFSQAEVIQSAQSPVITVISYLLVIFRTWTMSAQKLVILVFFPFVVGKLALAGLKFYWGILWYWLLDVNAFCKYQPFLWCPAAGIILGEPTLVRASQVLGSYFLMCDAGQFVENVKPAHDWDSSPCFSIPYKIFSVGYSILGRLFYSWSVICATTQI